MPFNVTCPTCGHAFMAPNRRQRFCSLTCRRSRTPPEVRFWKYVRMTDCCWLWTGGTVTTDAGLTYGVFGYGTGAKDKRQTTAHRYSLMLQLGRDLLPGMQACHNCPCGDKELCVRPAHLWEGTRQQNIQDSIAKGRHMTPEQRRQPGSKNGRARLTESDVVAIWERIAAGDSDHQIMGAFSATLAMITKIRTGITWRHVISPHSPFSPPGEVVST
jgi:hypothetical protein